MKKQILIILTGIVFLMTVSCNDRKQLYRGVDEEEYIKSFSNRTGIEVNITSAVDSTLYAVYYQYPYDGESLAKQPVMVGKTPVKTSLQVPNDVEKLYIIGNGQMYESGVKDITIREGQISKSAGVGNISDKVLSAINTKYFPEATNNVKGEDLYKCTDLVIAETSATGNFNEADVWITFIGDGGSRGGGLYGKLWFYTYETGNQKALTLEQCTFYGVVNGEIRQVPYSDIQAYRNWVFYTQDEIKSGVSSYKKFKLGTFGKGLSIGFVYYGNSQIRFTTPHLNPYVNFNLKYLDKSGSFRINGDVANGFVRHINEDGFEGNILGMENRSVIEAKYDGDYNDMLCLLESNPLAIVPGEPIDPPVVNEFKTTEGIYLFEDNYPNKGDFDFNDAVVEYKIIDYYKTSNGAKQVIVKLLAKGAYYNNQFGFKVDNEYTPFIRDMKGYVNVREGEEIKEAGEPVSYTLYSKQAIRPYLFNGSDYILDSNYNTGEYPYVLEIPISDPDDVSWKFRWCLEGKNVDAAYYFNQSAEGGKRAGDWYKKCKDESCVFKR